MAYEAAGLEDLAVDIMAEGPESSAASIEATQKLVESPHPQLTRWACVISHAQPLDALQTSPPPATTTAGMGVTSTFSSPAFDVGSPQQPPGHAEGVDAQTPLTGTGAGGPLDRPAGHLGADADAEEPGLHSAVLDQQQLHAASKRSGAQHLSSRMVLMDSVPLPLVGPASASACDDALAGGLSSPRSTRPLRAAPVPGEHEVSV